MAEATRTDSPLAKVQNLRVALEQIEQRAGFYASKHRSDVREEFESIAQIARNALEQDGNGEVMRIIEAAARRTMQVLGGVKDTFNTIDRIVDGVKSRKKSDKKS